MNIFKNNLFSLRLLCVIEYVTLITISLKEFKGWKVGVMFNPLISYMLSLKFGTSISWGQQKAYAVI